MGEAFFLPDGDRFVATELTRGPWYADAQHAGPPAALLGRAVERFDGRRDVQVVRVTFEILRQVPIAPLEISTTLVRGGRSVEVVGASLLDRGAEVMRATAVRIRTVEGGPDRGGAAVTDPTVPEGGAPEAAAPPGPEHGEPLRFFPTGHKVAYSTAMEWRFVEGAFLEPGPATVWMRMRHPLVAGEEPSPLQRVLIAADSGNGVSSVLDWRHWLFINPDRPSTCTARRSASGSASRPGPPWNPPASVSPSRPSSTAPAPSPVPSRASSSPPAAEGSRRALELPITR